MKQEIKTLSITGWSIMVAGIGAIFGWAFFASLESASIAYGVIEPSEGVHQVQHLEGGIIKKIHVTDGALVQKGDTLITLDDTQARVQFDRIDQRLKASQVESHRLMLELENKPWELDPSFLGEGYSDYVAVQKTLFDSRQEAYEVEVDILNQKLVELDNVINGLHYELKAVLKQEQIFIQRLQDMSTLIKRKLASKTEKLDLETVLAEYQAKVGRIKANIARVRQQIGETKLKKMRIAPKRLADITSEYQKNQELQLDLAERLKAARDVLSRKAIYSNVTGKVTDLNVKAPGDVIDESESIMNIVPASDQMIVRARVNPDDIDVVSTGMDVDIRFTAYSNRRMHPAKGSLTEISPDRKAAADGSFYFESVIEIDSNSLDKTHDIDLHPGMSAQLAIINGERRVWEYFIDPIISMSQLSLREN